MVFRGEYDADIPKKNRSIFLKSVFAPLKAAQKMYERCEEIDVSRWKHFVEVVMPNAPRLNPIEVGILDAGQALLEEESSGFARISGSLVAHPTVSLFLKNANEGNEGSEAWGKGIAQVDTAAETAVAWLWEHLSYERVLAHKEENGDLPRSEAVIEYSRCKIIRNVKKLRLGLGHRIFENLFVWDKKQKSDGSNFYLLSFAPADEGDGYVNAAWSSSALREARSFSNDAATFAKGTTSGAWKVNPIGQNICEVTTIQTMNLGGSRIPGWLPRATLVSGLLAVKRLQMRFRRSDRIVDKVRRFADSPSQELSRSTLPVLGF